MFAWRPPPLSQPLPVHVQSRTTLVVPRQPGPRSSKATIQLHSRTDPLFCRQESISPLRDRGVGAGPWSTGARIARMSAATCCFAQAEVLGHPGNQLRSGHTDATELFGHQRQAFDVGSVSGTVGVIASIRPVPVGPLRSSVWSTRLAGITASSHSLPDGSAGSVWPRLVTSMATAAPTPSADENSATRSPLLALPRT